MIEISLDKEWQLKKLSDAEPQESASISLPFDICTALERDFDYPDGEYNGYCRTASVKIERELTKIPKAHKVFLDLAGVSGVCDISLNGARLKTAVYSSRCLTDLTANLCQSKNVFGLSIGAYADSGRYTGLGISSGAKLYVVEEPLYIEPYGLFVKTVKLDSRAYLDVSAQVVNDGAAAKTVTVQTEIFNQKQKRVAKKLKKVKLAAGTVKTVATAVKLARPYEWNGYDPYLYSCKVTLIEDGEKARTIDSAQTSFGISRAVIEGKSFKHNNTPLKIKGVVMAHDNGILGNVSELSAELYKLGKIKSMGFNAVRYIGCPSDSALEALDRLGLMCVVDLFGVYTQSRFLNDGHLFFEQTYSETVRTSVLSLRNHPSVIMYSLGDNIEETYGRAGGAETIKRVLNTVKLYDASRLTTINAFERAPTQKEIEKYDVKNMKAAAGDDKKSLLAAREKDLFRQCTQSSFSLVDVAGYSYLYGRYSTDKGRMIIGLATSRNKAFEALEEIEKNPHVIGDFIFAGADFIGSYDMHDGTGGGRPHNNASGLLDITYRQKELSYYNEIILGKRNGAYILVEDPDSGDPAGAGFDVENASHLWNWPRHIGKPVKIRVVTSGDIVSLTLDGKAVGRKLAGKFNKNIADFKTNFYPGKLEAVSFHKGVEQSRVTLESVTSPKLLKIECSTKSLKKGELCFVDIYAADKEGRVVPYAMRDISVFVTGDGTLEMVGNGNPEHFSRKGENSCPVHNGVITAVVRANAEGKIILKATSEGLLSNKATIKVK